MFKRGYVRLKGWLTLGSIGIMPRLIIAFASVAALAATANLIVDKGVALVEQQRTEARERHVVDSRQIVALRESTRQARRAALSAELLNAVSALHRAAQDHADEDSRGSARQYARARAALDETLARLTLDGGDAPAPLPSLVAAHKKSADRLVQSRRSRRELLGRYSEVLSRMSLHVQSSIEQGWKARGRAVAREPLLDVGRQLDQLRATFANYGAFGAGEVETGPLAAGERTLAATLSRFESVLRRSPGA
jgi:hypothetical protein